MHLLICHILAFVAVFPTLLMERRDNAALNRDAIITAEFIFEQAPFPSCHASTIAETKGGLIAAWFAGTREKNTDVGISVSRHDKAGWSKLSEVANGVQPTGERYPCWNPVLF